MENTSHISDADLHEFLQCNIHLEKKRARLRECLKLKFHQWQQQTIKQVLFKT